MTESQAPKRGTLSELGPRGSIAQQFFQVAARRVFALIRVFAAPNSFRHVEVLAEVRHVFFMHQISAALAALLGHGLVVVNAIQTHFQIRAALQARLEAAGASRQFVFAAAIVAMTSHAKRLNDE